MFGTFNGGVCPAPYLSFPYPPWVSGVGAMMPPGGVTSRKRSPVPVTSEPSSTQSLVSQRIPSRTTPFESIQVCSARTGPPDSSGRSMRSQPLTGRRRFCTQRTRCPSHHCCPTPIGVEERFSPGGKEIGIVFGPGATAMSDGPVLVLHDVTDGVIRQVGATARPECRRATIIIEELR